MKTRVDSRLRLEAAKYELRFTCPDCAHFDPDEERCAEGYPTDEHRDTQLLGEEILFCKLFEGA